MNLKIILLALVLVLLGCWSCSGDQFSQIAEVDLGGHEPALVVHAHLEANSDSIGVYISHSLGILDRGNYELISNAQIDLYKEEEFLTALEPDGVRGFYKRILSSPLTADAYSYRLEVSAPDFPTVTAMQSMPPLVEIADLVFVRNGILNSDGKPADELQIVIDDPGGMDHYYAISIEVEFDTLEYVHRFYTNDLFVEKSTIGNLISDAAFDGQRYVVRYIYESQDNYRLQEKDRILVSLKSVTKARYLYEQSRNVYNQSKNNPFSEPVVLFENIENGHGIFSLGTVSRKVLQW